ncbi:DUF4435 domain-containing protein [Pseudomonas sp. NPDC086112]|uniref:DUF4435 domain-containing protein n=1 Tax=Pseudomonas sp. NPDC086112 TaxID=3364430 RepID=UPI00382CA725
MVELSQQTRGAGLIDSMRKAREIPQVVLQQYSSIRSKGENSLICVFEGNDDLPYYGTVFRLVANDHTFAPILSKGKEQLLAFRQLLTKRELNDPNIAYFIDRDFDGFKGYPEGDDVYCTDGYSIENQMVGPDVLYDLLGSEYKCEASNDSACVDAIVQHYGARLNEFVDVMRPVNQIIYYARKNKIPLSGIENKIRKYLKFEDDAVVATDNDVFELVGWPEFIDYSSVDFNDQAFLELDPIIDWRGKFLFGFFVEMLTYYKADRTSEQPKHFGSKIGVKFDPRGESVRVFAVLAPVPDALRRFILRLPGRMGSQ